MNTILVCGIVIAFAIFFYRLYIEFKQPIDDMIRGLIFKFNKTKQGGTKMTQWEPVDDDYSCPACPTGRLEEKNDGEFECNMCHKVFRKRSGAAKPTSGTILFN